MKLLVSGGTIFLGRYFVEESLKRGHEMTIFNRGKSNLEIFPQVEKLIGDRDGNLEALKGRRWDAALDTSGTIPRTVKESARLLSSTIDHYAFISSISVYDETVMSEIDEDSPVRKLSDETVEEITGETYGALKVLCEGEVEKAMQPGSACPVWFDYRSRRSERSLHILALAVGAGGRDSSTR